MEISVSLVSKVWSISRGSGGVHSVSATCICSCGFLNPQGGAQSEEGRGGVEAPDVGYKDGSAHTCNL